MTLNSNRKALIIITILILAGAGVMFLFASPLATTVKKLELKNSSSEEIAVSKEEKNKDDILGDFPPTKDNSDNKIQRSSDFVMEEKNSGESSPDDKNTTASGDEKYKLNIASKLVNSGFQKSSGRNINAIIIHSSYDAIGGDPFNVDGLIREYKNYGVAPHYLIDRAGEIYRLVEDKNIAYHAGAGRLPDGRTNINEISIGIELMNTKDGKFTPSQYETLNKLIKNLKSKYSIKYVLGHNQIAPGRKDDPWNFDWGKI